MIAHTQIARAGKLAALLITCFLLSFRPGQCRLGESFAAYRAKLAASWKYLWQEGSGAKTNYHFSLIVTPEQESASAGYAAGLTITVAAGKVTGQSIAFRAGDNQMVGAAMATAHGFAFAYESIGKPMPRDKARVDNEFKQFSKAVGQAFMGHKQIIRYPGYSGMITVTTDAAGDLIVAATAKPAPQQARISKQAKN